jgi:hypothetical protein
MATPTPVGSRASIEVSINDNLPSSNPYGKMALVVLGSVLGFIVLAFLYYQTIGL